MEGLLEQTSERARAEFASWPRTAVEAVGYMDDDGVIRDVPLTIAVRLWTTADGELLVDLAGSAAQSPGGMNVPWASLARRRLLRRPGVPRAGRAAERRAHPPRARALRGGRPARPRFPAAARRRHLAVQRLTDVVIEALGDLLPDRSVAATHVSFPALVFQAVDPRNGRVTIITDILGGGGGARPGAPGDAAIDPYTSNCALLPAEIAELEYPWRIERTELVEGSGGAGLRRAAPACGATTRCWPTSGDGMYYVEQTNPAFAARGREGGGPGAPGAILLRRAGADEFEQLPGKGEVRMRTGDTLRLLGAAAAASAPPDKRPASQGR